MARNAKVRKEHPGIGYVLILAGLLPILISLGIINPDPASIHAPMWVIGLSGMVFVLAGVMVLIGTRSRFNSLLAALFCAFFGVIGAWVAFYSPPGEISGGIPLAPDSFNQTLGRWAFGIGAALSFLLSAFALRQFFRAR